MSAFQLLFLGYILGGATATLCAYLTGNKKAAADADTSNGRQPKPDRHSIPHPDPKNKEEI